MTATLPAVLSDLPTRFAVAKHAAALIASLAPRREVCVQAGGHIGLWPQALSQYFAAVYTFEPQADNWRGLQKHAQAANIYAARGVLGCAVGGVSMQTTTGKSGMWFTAAGGPIPTYRVDDLGLPTLDALVLDIEGDELPALKGAEQSLTRHHPLVWFEGHEHGASRGGSTDQIIAWLHDRGYGAPRKGYGRDLYMRVA